jgi:hypothetical protein
MRQLSDGNFVERRLLMDFGDLHSRPHKKGKARQESGLKGRLL